MSATHSFNRGNHMNKPEFELPVRRASFIDRSIDAWQGLVVIFLGLVVLGTLLDASKLSAPGAPIALFWSTVGAGALLVITHLPAVLHRLPRRAGWVVYA